MTTHERQIIFCGGTHAVAKDRWVYGRFSGRALATHNTSLLFSPNYIRQIPQEHVIRILCYATPSAWHLQRIIKLIKENPLRSFVFDCDFPPIVIMHVLQVNHLDCLQFIELFDEMVEFFEDTLIPSTLISGKNFIEKIEAYPNIKDFVDISLRLYRDRYHF